MRISYAQLWVHDQDEALAFYTEKLGMEVLADVTLAEMEDFRWLVVNPPGQPEVGITLMKLPEDGHPMFEPETIRLLRDLTARGAGATVFLTTEDCRGDYEMLSERGVEFVEAPEQRPYGIDCGFRDPSGNHLRLTQPQEIEVPTA
ncbi:MAG: hypothetical protein QOE75_319 [Solirubrobacterales bacterium]|jgi:catechol 2,3-dioxygenase-like lactoylglutathione lyase family enzyme|nr:hypothetical protein [Solirubrobacterales bacterium]